MKNYITLTFWNRKTDQEFTIQIEKSNISTFRLYDIVDTLRLKQDEYIQALVVNQFHIIAKTKDLTKEIVENYNLEEISIYEDNKLFKSFSVKYTNTIKKFKYENNTLELLKWSEVKSNLQKGN
jgi:hypothetical protein